jgi:hypothetical protein
LFDAWELVRAREEFAERPAFDAEARRVFAEAPFFVFLGAITSESCRQASDWYADNPHLTAS